MATKTIGIIINGATGRIGSTQHIRNALVPIRNEGGLEVAGDRLIPRLLLVGRDAERLAAIAQAHEIPEWTTDLDAALADRDFSVFFDAAATSQRAAAVEKAIAAGKHIYCEKPVAISAVQGASLVRAAEARGLKHGAVEDKVYLPGLQKLARLAEAGFFGRTVGFRLEFGWWVFDGTEVACQRPSWNYRRLAGGGLVLDMYPHWRYVIERIIGRIAQVASVAWTATPERVDERGGPYAVDVEDSCATLVKLENGASGTILSSWATRVRRDDLLTLQIDGTGGSAIAGLHRCWMQAKADTPAIQHFNPDRDPSVDYRADWQEVIGGGPYINPYRTGWENFLRHVVNDAPLTNDLRAGVRDVQLAEACYRSATERKWVSFDEIIA